LGKLGKKVGRWVCHFSAKVKRLIVAYQIKGKRSIADSSVVRISAGAFGVIIFILNKKQK
jgi:hypothetical protein